MLKRRNALTGDPDISHPVIVNGPDKSNKVLVRPRVVVFIHSDRATILLMWVFLCSSDTTTTFQPGWGLTETSVILLSIYWNTSLNCPVWWPNFTQVLPHINSYLALEFNSWPMSCRALSSWGSLLDSFVKCCIYFVSCSSCIPMLCFHFLLCLFFKKKKHFF